MSTLKFNALPSFKDFSNSSRANYHQVFDLIDENKDGKLSKEELQHFISKINWEPFYSDLIFRIFDKNNDGYISFLEFMSYSQAQEDLKKNPRNFYNHLFNSLDKDHNGYLSSDEILEFASTVGLTISIEEANQLINNAPNKKFNFTELCKVLDI